MFKLIQSCLSGKHVHVQKMDFGNLTVDKNKVLWFQLTEDRISCALRCRIKNKIDKKKVVNYARCFVCFLYLFLVTDDFFHLFICNTQETMV